MGVRYLHLVPARGGQRRERGGGGRNSQTGRGKDLNQRAVTGSGSSALRRVARPPTGCGSRPISKPSELTGSNVSNGRCVPAQLRLRAGMASRESPVSNSRTRLRPGNIPAPTGTLQPLTATLSRSRRGRRVSECVLSMSLTAEEPRPWHNLLSGYSFSVHLHTPLLLTPTER